MRQIDIIALTGADMLVVAGAIQLAYLTRFDGPPPLPFSQAVPATTLTSIVVYVFFNWILGLYRQVWRYAGAEVYIKTAFAASLSFTTLIGLDIAAGVRSSGARPVPVGTLAIAFAFVLIGMSAVRGQGRASAWFSSQVRDPDATRVLIIGAGDAGSLLLRDIENQPQLGLRVVGFLDDDSRKIGRRLRTAQVLGPIDALPKVVRTHDVSEVYVALPSASSAQRRRILDICSAQRVTVKTTSSLARSVHAGFGISYFHRLQIEDLLGRDTVALDTSSLTASINARTVLVTGAAGSIGSELCRQIARYGPRRLTMLDIDESRLHDAWQELSASGADGCEIRIADVRNAEKMSAIIEELRPDLVLHAAAYKHVPLMEDAPDEAVLANVLGTANLVGPCVRAGCHFVLISTDKAVEPSSVMGVTKWIAELTTLQGCREGLRGSVVRFGNVLGSRGSVVPLFEEQLRRGGPLRVTHPDVTRYFMTIPEASALVLQAQAIASGGSVLVLDMGEPVRILDLAKKMISLSSVKADIVFTGLRPAEKLSEVLVGQNESLVASGHDKILTLSSMPLLRLDISSTVDQLIAAAKRRDAASMLTWFEVLSPGFRARNADACTTLGTPRCAPPDAAYDGEQEADAMPIGA